MANFQNANVLVKENDTNQKTIIIALSKPTPDSGTLLTLNSINSEHGVDFETTPAAINNEIKLFVSKGDVAVQFAIKALQNTIIKASAKLSLLQHTLQVA